MQAALILIDMQQAFDDEAYWGGNRNNKSAEVQAARILAIWRQLQWPIFHVRHSSQSETSPLHVSHPGFAFKEETRPMGDEPVITKDVNSAFIGTDLQARLDAQGIQSLVILGLTTNHCVSTTTRMAGNLGYETIVIADATATFDRVGIHGEAYDAQTIHLTALASLNGEFAEVIDTDTLLARIEGHS